MVLSRARWWRITPVLFITYSFAYLDRVNYSFAAVGGIGRDLHVSASTEALIGALFFFGYFAGQIPGAIYAERNSPKKLIFACLILWGVFSTLTGLVSNVTALMVVRFLLGVVEAAVFPSLLIFINHWFSKSERSVANATTVLATPVTLLWMSILSGYLVHSWGWRAMFIAEGLPASLWGIAWWFLVQDRPTQVSWLKPAERNAIEAKIAAEQGGMKPMRNYGEAFRSPVVIRLSILYFFWGLSLFGFILWLPTIIRQSGSATSHSRQGCKAKTRSKLSRSGGISRAKRSSAARGTSKLDGSSASRAISAIAAPSSETSASRAGAAFLTGRCGSSSSESACPRATASRMPAPSCRFIPPSNLRS